MTALTAADVAKCLKYSNGARVRSMFRAGTFPPPIDPKLPPVAWRWSPRVVADYIDGQVAA